MCRAWRFPLSWGMNRLLKYKLPSLLKVLTPQDDKEGEEPFWFCALWFRKRSKNGKHLKQDN